MRAFVPLKRRAHIQYGLGQPPHLSDDGVAIIRATNIFRGRIVANDLIRAHVEDLPLARAPLLRLGELLVVRSGAYTGDSALITPEWVGAAPGYDLRVTGGRALEPRFIAYTMLGRRAMDQIDLAKSRAAQPHLNAEDLGEVEVFDTPLANQCAIADYLDRETARIDALIAAKRRMVQLLEERSGVVRDRLLGSASAPIVKLGRFVQSIGQGVSPEAEARPVEDGEWGVLKLSAVKSGRFIPLENKALPTDFVPIPSMVPRTGDLLVTRANTPPLVGDVCAVTVAYPRVMLCDLIYVLRMRSGLDPEYAAQALLTRHARLQISSAARGTSQSMVKLRGEDVKSVVIPVPNIGVQRSLVAKIASQASHVENMRTALERSIQLLRERRQALITAAVTGRLDIPEAA